MTIGSISLLALLPALVAPASYAAGGTWVGLAPGNSLVIIDGGAAAVTRTVKIGPVQGDVVGIDVRPKDGKLYALTDLGTLYTIDPMSGRPTVVISLDKAIDSGPRPAVDFNPVADRLRVLGLNGASYRINVDTGQVTVDGSLKYDGTDMHAGKSPMVTAAAYTNSMPGAKETALYDIDTALGTLALQAPPNDGILKSRGMLGTAVSAFDIVTDAAGISTGYAVSGRALYTVDLASGKATRIGAVKGLRVDLKDLAALPM